MSYITIEGVRTRLKAACDKAGGQTAWAEQNGLAQPYVSQVLSGMQAPGPAILSKLGLEKVVKYRQKEMPCRTEHNASNQ